MREHEPENAEEPRAARARRVSRRRQQALDAERMVLGAVLLAPQCYADVEALLEPEDFQAQRHSATWAWIQVEHAAGRQPDALAAATSDAVEQMGGPSYVMQHADDLPTFENVRFYAQKVAREALRGRIRQAAVAVAQAVEDEEDPAVALEVAERRLQTLAGATAPQDFVHVSQIATEQWKTWAERSTARARGSTARLSTGYPDLDRITGGHGAGHLVIVAGRPAMGKTAWVLNVIRYLVPHGIGVALCSQEMTRGECLDRILGAEAKVQGTLIRDGIPAKDRAWDHLADVVDAWNRHPLWVTDTAGMRVGQLATRTRRLKARHPELGLLIVDYLQIMGVENQRANREEQVALIARGLKQLAKDVGIPVVAVAQLNRSVETRPNKRPTMSDLRESGQIEQDADCILFLYRDEYYHPDSQDVGVAEVIVAKNRHGESGRTARLRWDAALQRFDSLDTRHSEYL